MLTIAKAYRADTLKGPGENTGFTNVSEVDVNILLKEKIAKMFLCFR